MNGGVIDLYETLNVSPNADSSEIREAIKRERRLWRKRTGSAELSKKHEADRKMSRLAEAEDVLLDSTKRAEYDRQLVAAPTPARTARPTNTGQINWLEMALNYIEEGDYRSAAHAAKKVTRERSSSALAWAALSRANAGLGNYDDALFEACQAAKLKPDCAEYQYDLGSIYESMKSWSDALRSYQRGAELDPSNHLFPASMAGVFLQNDLPEKALPIVQALHEEHSDDGLVAWYYALTMRDMAMAVPSVRKDDTYLLTSAEEVEQMESFLRRGMHANHGDKDLETEFLETLRHVEKVRGFTFSTPAFFEGISWFWALLLFLSPLLLFCGGLVIVSQGSAGRGLGAIALGCLAGFGLVRACWVPGWVRNKRWIES